MKRPLRAVCFGECMLELRGEAFGLMRQSFGGDTLNTAIYLARTGRFHGIHVDYATALGDDSLSAGMLQRWQAEGLSTELVRRLPGRLPGLYQIEVDPLGERRFSYWRDQAAARDYFETPSDDTPLERCADTIDALYFSGISLAILPEAGRERLLKLAARLRAHGALVAFDNNYRPRLWSDGVAARSWFARAYEIACIALVTLDDEMALAGEPEAARQLKASLALPVPELVIKRGADPTLVRLADDTVAELPTVEVRQVIDTTAAGDSFAGAYLAERMAGMGPREAAAWGNRLAATVVQHAGAVIPLSEMPLR